MKTIRIQKNGNICIYLAIITAVLSFSINERLGNICSYLMYVFFFLTIMEIIFKSGKIIRVNRTVYYMVGVYIIWWILTKILYQTGVYMSSGIGVVGFLRYCIIFYILGLNLRIDNTGGLIKKMSLSFAIGQMLLMVTLLPKVNEISTYFYQFGAKNQMGQMLGIGIILDLFILPELFDGVSRKVVFYGLGTISLIALMLIHSRTPIIAIVVVSLITFIFKPDKEFKQYMHLLGIVIVACLVIHYMGGMEYIKELFSSSEYSDLQGADAMLSGRLGLWEIAIKDFLQNPLVGVGAWAYIDNFILNTLRCGGIILAILIFPIAYGKLLFSFLRAKRYVNNKTVTNGQRITSQILWGMIPFYLVISFMEGYPPLGPGSSLFFLWIMIGIFDTERGKNGFSNYTDL